MFINEDLKIQKNAIYFIIAFLYSILLVACSEAKSISPVSSGPVVKEQTILPNLRLSSTGRGAVIQWNDPTDYDGVLLDVVSEQKLFIREKGSDEFIFLSTQKIASNNPHLANEIDIKSRKVEIKGLNPLKEYEIRIQIFSGSRSYNSKIIIVNPDAPPSPNLVISRAKAANESVFTQVQIEWKKKSIDYTSIKNYEVFIQGGSFTNNTKLLKKDTYDESITNPYYVLSGEEYIKVIVYNLAPEKTYYFTVYAIDENNVKSFPVKESISLQALNIVATGIFLEIENERQNVSLNNSLNLQAWILPSGAEQNIKWLIFADGEQTSIYGEIEPVKGYSNYAVFTAPQTMPNKISKKELTLIATNEQETYKAEVAITLLGTPAPTSITIDTSMLKKINEKNYLNIGDNQSNIVDFTASVIPADAFQEIEWRLGLNYIGIGNIDPIGKYVSPKTLDSATKEIQIEVFSKADPNIKSEVFVTLFNESLTFSDETKEIQNVFEGTQKKLNVTYEGLSNFMWTLNTEEVGSITQEGLYTAQLAEGIKEVEVSVTVSGTGEVTGEHYEKMHTFIVKRLSVENLELSPQAVSLFPNDKKQFVVKISPSNALLDVTWEINPPGIGSIDVNTQTYTAPATYDNKNTLITLKAISVDNPSVFDTATITLMPLSTHSFIASIKDGVNGVDGLSSVNAVAVSSDNKNIYAVSTEDKSVTVFSYKEEKFVYENIFKNNEGGVSGLSNARDIHISPDQKNIYVVSGGRASDDNAIVVFNRNTTTGSLTFAKSIKRTSLLGATALDISSDNKHVYIAAKEALVIFTRDTNTGSLTYNSTLSSFPNTNNNVVVETLAESTALRVSPNGAYVYVLSVGSNVLNVFARNVTSGKLTKKQALTTVTTEDGESKPIEGLQGAMAVVVSRDSQYVYVAGTDDYIAVFKQNADKLNYVSSFKDTQDRISFLSGKKHLAMSPDGSKIYVVVAGSINSFRAYNRNATLGSLSVNKDIIFENNKNITGIAGASDLDVVGRYIYVSGAGDNSIVLLDATLVQVKTKITDGDNGNSGLQKPKSVIVSSDNKNVYVVSEDDNSLAVFQKNNVGELEYLEVLHQDDTVDVQDTTIEGLQRPSLVKLDSKSQSVYVLSEFNGTLAVFMRKDDGTLEYKQVFSGIGSDPLSDLTGATNLVVSPNGKHVYVGNKSENTILIFTRTTQGTNVGELEYKESIRDDEYLLQMTSFIINAQNKVYVSYKNGISIYNRDENTGMLSWDKSLVEGIDGVQQVTNLNFLTEHPKGQVFYAIDSVNNLLVTFSISLANNFSLIGSYALSSESLGTQLNGVSALRVSPDGHGIYVVSFINASIGVFAYNKSTNRLVYSANSLITNISDVQDIAISNDNTKIYAISTSENTLYIYNRKAP